MFHVIIVNWFGASLGYVSWIGKLPCLLPYCLDENNCLKLLKDPNSICISNSSTILYWNIFLSKITPYKKYDDSTDLTNEGIEKCWWCHICTTIWMNNKQSAVCVLDIRYWWYLHQFKIVNNIQYPNPTCLTQVVWVTMVLYSVHLSFTRQVVGATSQKQSSILIYMWNLNITLIRVKDEKFKL